MNKNYKKIKAFANQDIVKSLFYNGNKLTKMDDYKGENMKRSQYISSSWMGICLLSLQLPQNLDVGVQVNCRTAKEEQLVHKEDTDKPSIVEAIYLDNHNFQNNVLDCTFFKLENYFNEDLTKD